MSYPKEVSVAKIAWEVGSCLFMLTMAILCRHSNPNWALFFAFCVGVDLNRGLNWLGNNLS